MSGFSFGQASNTPNTQTNTPATPAIGFAFGQATAPSPFQNAPWPGQAASTPASTAAAAHDALSGSKPIVAPFAQGNPTGNAVGASGFGAAPNSFGFGFSSTPNASQGATFGSIQSAASSAGFGSSAPASGANTSMGSTTSATGFGSLNAGQATGFGGPSNSGFGKALPTLTSSGFNATPASGFGNTPAPALGFGNIATPAPGFGFGQAPSTSSNSPFGSSTTATPAFGGTAPVQSNPSTAFGQSTSATSFGNGPAFGASAATPHVAFGSTSASPPSVFDSTSATATSSVFGASNNNAAPVFGAPSNSTINVFGAGSSQPSVFGGAGASVFATAIPASNNNTGFMDNDRMTDSPPTVFAKPAEPLAQKPSFSFGLPATTSSVSKSGNNTLPTSKSAVFAVQTTPKPSETTDITKEDRLKRFTTASDASVKRDEMKKKRDQREKDYFASFKQRQLDDAHDVVGTCDSMCPEFERYDREVSQELHFFEMLPGTEQVDHAAAVKKYRRSAAGQDPEIFPEDIRPPRVLKQTMEYLTTNILQRTDQDFSEVYNFIRDRGRAIRKDFKVQNHLKGPECVDVLEKLGRFLIHSDFMLCELPESKYSWKQNRHQLIDTLTTLIEIYDDEVDERGNNYVHEPEFRAYFLLLNIDDVVPVSRMQSWRPAIRQHPMVVSAMAFHQLYQNRHVALFFEQVKQPSTTYLMACILHFAFNHIRKEGLKGLLSALAHKDKAFPVTALTDTLCFDSDHQTQEFCSHWGFETAEESISVNGETKTYTGIRLGRRDSWIEPVTQLKVKRSEMVARKSSNASHSDVVRGTGAADIKFSLSEQPSLGLVKPSISFSSSGPSQTSAKPFNFNLAASPFVPSESSATTAAPPSEVDQVKKAEFTFQVPAVPAKEIEKPEAKSAESPKPPKPDYSAQTGPVTAEMVDLVVQEMIPSFVEPLLNQWKLLNTLPPHFANDILNEVLSGLVNQACSEQINHHRSLNAAIHHIAKATLEEVLFEMVNDLTRDKLAQRFNRKRQIGYALKTWRLHAAFQIEQRRLAEERRQKLVETMRRMPLVYPSLMQQQSLAATKYMKPLTISDLSYSLATKDTIRVLKQDVISKREPMDIAAILRASERTDSTSMKVAISVSDNASSPWNLLSQWTLQKFKIGMVPEELQQVKCHSFLIQHKSSNAGADEKSLAILPSDDLMQCSLSYNSSVLTFFTVNDQRRLGGKIAFLATQPLFGVNERLDSLSLVREENCSSSLSGTTSVLFSVCDVTSTVAVQADKNRFYKLVASLPRFSKTSIAIAFWSKKDISDFTQAERNLEVSLGLAELQRKGYIGQYRVFQLGALNDHSLSDKASERLCHAFNWLVSMLPPDPVLTYNCFEAIRKFEQSFNNMVNLFNNLVEAFANFVSSDKLKEIVWPSDEVKQYLHAKLPFGRLPPRTWNADEHLKTLKSRVLRYQLPDLSIQPLGRFDDPQRAVIVSFRNYLSSISAAPLNDWSHSLITELTYALSDATQTRLMVKVFETLAGLMLVALRDEVDLEAIALVSEIEPTCFAFEQRFYGLLAQMASADSGERTSPLLNNVARKRASDSDISSTKRTCYHRRLPETETNTFELDEMLNSLKQERHRAQEFGKRLQSALEESTIE